uniref:Uncharacterized protein n=1 Tax=Bionectria ochroleuca TaxID=29856 RepID=A0A8H7NGH2_BIOOC
MFFLLLGRRDLNSNMLDKAHAGTKCKSGRSFLPLFLSALSLATPRTNRRYTALSTSHPLGSIVLLTNNQQQLSGSHPRSHPWQLDATPNTGRAQHFYSPVLPGRRKGFLRQAETAVSGMLG